MRVGLALFLLFALAVGLVPSDARAHGTMAAGPQHEMLEDAPGSSVGDVALRLDGFPAPHDHRPGKPGCLAACSGTGTILLESISVPVPQRVAPALLYDTARAPRSIQPPVEDQPPRTI